MPVSLDIGFVAANGFVSNLGARFRFFLIVRRFDSLRGARFRLDMWMLVDSFHLVAHSLKTEEREEGFDAAVESRRDNESLFRVFDGFVHRIIVGHSFEGSGREWLGVC